MKYNLPVILLRGTVLIPQNELKLEFEDELSKNIIDEAELFHDNKILIVTQSSLEQNIIIKDLPRIGTVAEITRKLELPNGKVRIALKGKTRAGVIEYLNPTRDIIESIVQVIPKEKIISVEKVFDKLPSYDSPCYSEIEFLFTKKFVGETIKDCDATSTEYAPFGNLDERLCGELPEDLIFELSNGNKLILSGDEIEYFAITIDWFWVYTEHELP